MATGLEFIEFYSRTRHEGGCLLWDGSKTIGGYGRLWFRGQYRLAHRVAVMLGGVEIPSDKWVLHKETCNKLCVNTEHLSLGTPSENLRSAWEAGKINTQKLVGSELQGLQWLVANGFPSRIATRAYGVSRGYLYQRSYLNKLKVRRNQQCLSQSL